MIKFHAKQKGKDVVGLVLTDDNIKMLKQDKPIFFSLSEEGFALDGRVIIAYDTEEFRANELAFRACPNTYVFVVDDELCEQFLKYPNGALNVPQDNIQFVLLYGKNQEEVYKRFRRLIGPTTKCVTKGFAPGERMDFSNN